MKVNVVKGVLMRRHYVQEDIVAMYGKLGLKLVDSFSGTKVKLRCYDDNDY